MLHSIIDSVKEHSGEYLLLINGVDINVYGDLNSVKVKNDDAIIFIPIVHGGKE